MNRAMEDKQQAIKVCYGPRCRDYGGQDLLTRLTEEGLDARTGDCQSLCPYSPVVHLNKKFIPRATAAEIIEQLS